MEPDVAARATAATTSLARGLGLAVDEAVVLQSSNALTLRLLPSDVVARVALDGRGQAAFEVALATQLAPTVAPVVTLDPRVEARGHRHDGVEVTFWAHHATTSVPLAAEAYADALVRVHAGLRQVDLDAPHCTERVARAEEVVTSPDLSPGLADHDRRLLVDTLRDLGPTLRDHPGPQQLLHGEPHPGNVLATAAGPVVIDLETCCRGPVELDLAHVPRDVAALYSGLDGALLDDCRHVVLAMVAAWRWERDDQLPNGRAFGHALLDILRTGPPWPTLEELHDGLDLPRTP